MKKYELVKQTDLKDCGVSSLASIAKYYKMNVSIEKLRDMTKTNRNGTTAYHIVETAKELGFESYGIECELKNFDLYKIVLPAIAYVVIDNSYKHFLVIYEIDFKNKKIITADPADKIKKITFQEFEKIFKNVLIIIYPIRKLISQTTLTPKIYIKKILNKYRKILLKVFALTLILMLLNILGLLFIKSMFKINNYEILILLLPIGICIELLKLFNTIYKNKLILKLDYEIDKTLTNEIFSKIILLPYSFYRNRTTGEVLSRISDLEKVKQLILDKISCFINICLIIVSGLFLIAINSFLFLVTLLVITFNVIIYLSFDKKIFSSLKKLKKEKEKIYSYMTEIIMGFETIKGLNLEKKFISNFEKNYNNYLSTKKTSNMIYNKSNISKEFINNLGFIFIIFTGLVLIKKNIITFADLIIYISFLSYFLDPIKQLFELEKEIKEAKISIHKIINLYFEENKIDNKEKIKNIEINNLNYSYDDNNYILSNLNLKIKPKDKILLFGPSGSGKSTILKLIKKYYKTNELKINNKINENKNIIYISQNEILFTDTLYNNIILNRNIKEERVKEIMNMCSIDSIYKNNILGYNMLIEENGFNISGGEKQRIILARALLTNFQVLLLDESFSEMDTNLERKILKNILNKFKNRTIIMISHRKDNLDLFNILMEFKNNKIEIVKRRGEYV